MKLVAFLLALSASFNVLASDRKAGEMTHDMKVCEETASLMTTAYTLHPVDAQKRVDFINMEKARIAADRPDLRIEDRHLLPAMGAITFHLVELKVLDSSQDLSKETQIRLAARSGAACGLLSGLESAP